MTGVPAVASTHRSSKMLMSHRNTGKQKSGGVKSFRVRMRGLLRVKSFYSEESSYDADIGRKVRSPEKRQFRVVKKHKES